MQILHVPTTANDRTHRLDQSLIQYLPELNLPPTLDRFRLENRASPGDGLAGIAGHSMKHCWHLVADRAVRSHLVVVSTPSLAFSACLVEAEEPIGVQALSPKLAVQAFDECVVGRLAGPAEVESDAAHEGPQVELLTDEFRPIVEPNGLWTADFMPYPVERVDDIDATKILPHLDRR